MNILFVHEVDWLRKVVFEVHTLAELLSLSGNRVCAIDYESMWVRKGPLDFGSLKTTVVERVNRAYSEASVRLIRPGFIKIPGVSRFSAACTSYGEISRTLIKEKIDAVVLYSVPTNGWQTVLLCKKLGVPVVFRAIDVLNQLVPSAALRPMTRVLEKRVYSNVDMVLSLSPRLSRYVIDMGVPESKVKLLLLGVDTAQFRPGIDATGLRQKWGLGDGPVIVFIGTLFGFSGLDVFIPRFSDVLKEFPSAKILIVGDGPQRPELESIIARSGLQKSVIITGFQPYQTMPQYINLASVCINTFITNGVTRDIFPSKILQYLACGRPVAATALPGLTAVVAGEQQGIVYANSAGEVAPAVISLLKSPERCRQTGEAGLRYVKEVHSYGKIAHQLEDILSQLVKEKHREHSPA